MDVREPSRQVSFLNANRIVSRTSVTTPMLQLGGLSLVSGGQTGIRTIGTDADLVTIGSTGRYADLAAFAQAYAQNPDLFSRTSVVLVLLAGTHRVGGGSTNSASLPAGVVLTGENKSTTSLTSGTVTAVGDMVIENLHIRDVSFQVKGSLRVQDVIHTTAFVGSTTTPKATFSVSGRSATFLEYTAAGLSAPILEVTGSTGVATVAFENSSADITLSGTTPALHVALERSAGVLVSIRNARVELGTDTPFLGFSGVTPQSGSVVELTHCVLKGARILTLAPHVELREGENTYIGAAAINLRGGFQNSTVTSTPLVTDSPDTTPLLEKVLQAQNPDGLNKSYSQIKSVQFDLLTAIHPTPDYYGAIAPLVAEIASPTNTSYTFSAGLPVPDLPGIANLQNMYDCIVSAQKMVDICLLWWYPDGYFLMMLQNALAAIQERPVLVRVIFGIYTYDAANDLQVFMADLRSKVTSPTAQLQIATGQRFNLDARYPFTHAKVVCADGAELVTGGENYWSPDYWTNTPFPVMDAIVHMTGDFTANTQYANLLWNELYMDENSYWPTPDADLNEVVVWTLSGGQQLGQDYGWPQFSVNFLQSRVTTQRIPHTPIGTASAPMMEISDSQAGPAIDVAIVALFENARTQIKLSQQQIYANFILDPYPIDPDHWPSHYTLSDWAQSFTNALAGAINRGVPVEMIYSKWLFSEPLDNGQTLAGYASGCPPWYIKAQVKRVFSQKGWDETKVDQLLTQKIVSYDKATDCYQHDKIFIVDDVVVIGSFNIYTNSLDEYSLCIESAEFRSRVETMHWNVKWSNAVLQEV